MFTFRSYVKKILDEIDIILKEADSIRSQKINLIDSIPNKERNYAFFESSATKRLNKFIKEKEIPFVIRVNEDVSEFLKKEARFTAIAGKAGSNIGINLRLLWEFFADVEYKSKSLIDILKDEQRFLDETRLSEFFQKFKEEVVLYVKIGSLHRKFLDLELPISNKQNISLFRRTILRILAVKGTSLKKVISTFLLILVLASAVDVKPAYSFNIIKSVAKVLGYKTPLKEAAEEHINKAMDEIAPLINKYSKELNVDPRIVAGVIFVEMFRNFTTEKGYLEKYLENTNLGETILSIANHTYGIGQMSKSEFFECINHLQDLNSEFYLGEGLKEYVSYDDVEKSKDNVDIQIKFTVVMIKQLISQWEKAGFDISKRPEILGTLYNIGFKNSYPKQNPRSGGSINHVEFGEKSFTGNFGECVKWWYDSGLNPTIK